MWGFLRQSLPFLLTLIVTFFTGAACTVQTPQKTTTSEHSDTNLLHRVDDFNGRLTSNEFSGIDDPELILLIDNCLTELETMDFVEPDHLKSVLDPGLLEEIQEIVRLEKPRQELQSLSGKTTGNPLIYDDIGTARQMIEQKRVRVGWIGGDHLLGKLQEYEQVRSGKFILAINSNLQKIPKRYHRHVCGVVLHEVKHLEQLLSLLVTQTLNLNNHLSDEHIAQLEDEAYQIEDRYLRFYNLRRDQLQLPRSQMTGFITSSQAHGVLQPEWFKMILTEMIQQVPKGDIERLRLQRLQLALHDPTAPWQRSVEFDGGHRDHSSVRSGRVHFLGKLFAASRIAATGSLLLSRLFAAMTIADFAFFTALSLSHRQPPSGTAPSLGASRAAATSTA
jgi:hypothetical protein